MGFRGSRVQIPPSRLRDKKAGVCPPFLSLIVTTVSALAPGRRLGRLAVAPRQIPPSRLSKQKRVNQLGWLAFSLSLLVTHVVTLFFAVNLASPVGLRGRRSISPGVP